MKPLQQFSFFITRAAATANGLAEFTAVGNSCHKDCPRVRLSWYRSSLPWSHRNPSPSDAAVSQKKLSTSLLMGPSGQSGFHRKKARGIRAETAKPWDSCPSPHSKFQDSWVSVHQADGKQGDGTRAFQEPRQRQKPQSLDSQAWFSCKVIYVNWLLQKYFFLLFFLDETYKIQHLRLFFFRIGNGTPILSIYTGEPMIVSCWHMI